jgi:hypothetical protein
LLNPTSQFIPRNYFSKLKIPVFFIFSILLAGCVSLSRNEQSTRNEFVRIGEDKQVGQTFLARFDGLQGVSIFLKPIETGSGDIHLELFSDQTATEPVRASSLPISDIYEPGFYTFTFPPLKTSTSQDYFYNLTLKGPGVLETGAASGKSYMSGAQYIDNIAQNSQGSFRLEYASGLFFLGLIKMGMNWAGILIISLALLAIPGIAALIWLYPPWSSSDWISRLGLALGIGLAFYPVLFLWSNTIGIQLGRFNALVLPIVGLIFIGIRKFLDLRNPAPEKRESHIQINWAHRMPEIVFLVIMALIIFTRFWPIRNLDAPMWGDSYQHTMMAQLLVDNGGLFSNWEPYAQLTSFTYHFGFHTIAASIHWLTNLDVIQSTLVTGQLINIFAIIALYPLALTIGKNRWAGVIAVLVAGLISSMPMFYANWGRYTQLAGQLILPAIIVVLWANLDTKQVSFKWHLLVWFGLAGLALTHYRVMIFIPLFYISYIIFQFRHSGVINVIKRTFVHLAGVVILIIPWVFRIFEGTLPLILGTQITTTAAQVTQTAQQLNSIGNITVYLPLIVWILLLISIFWGIITQNRESNIFVVWCLLILLAANPQWFMVPGSGILTNFAVFIAAYIPASVIIGSGAADLLSRLNVTTQQAKIGAPSSKFRAGDRKHLPWSVSLSIILVLIAIWFVIPRIRDIQPAAHALITRPDSRAASWIIQQLPRDAKFLVNSFFAYGGSSVVGSDGGWWLPLITTRKSTQPPLTYVSEAGMREDYINYTNDLIALIDTVGINHPDVLEELIAREITHIYIGQQQGSVNGSPLLDIKDLLKDQNFNLIYNQDRVYIFEVVN